MDSELPLGFAMALAMNEPAMKNFESLSPEEKAVLVRRIHGVKSRDEMRRFVDQLAQPQETYNSMR